MAFDFGFDFRGTAGYVTDPSYAVAVLGGVTHAYPFTFTNADGLSINAGWTSNTFISDDRTNTVDPRLAGENGIDASTPARDFKVDLSSGSAPGTGDYTVAFAGGDPGGFSPYTAVAIKDNATAFITIPFTTITPTTDVIDATGTQHTLANWPANNTSVAHTFASTTCVASVSDGTGGAGQFAMICHFRLTKAQTAFPWMYYAQQRMN